MSSHTSGREFDPTALSDSDLVVTFVGGSVELRDDDGEFGLFLGDGPVGPLLDYLAEREEPPDDADLLVARGTGEAAAESLDQVLSAGEDWSGVDVRHPDLREPWTALDVGSLARQAVENASGPRELAGRVVSSLGPSGGTEADDDPDPAGQFGPVLATHGVEGAPMTAGERVAVGDAAVVPLNGRGQAVVPEVVSAAGEHSVVLGGVSAEAEGAAWRRRRSLNTDWSHYADHGAVAAVEHPSDGESTFVRHDGRVSGGSFGVVFNHADAPDSTDAVERAGVEFALWTAEEGQGAVRVGVADGDDGVSFTTTESSTRRVPATPEGVRQAAVTEPTPDEASPIVDQVERETDVDEESSERSPTDGGPRSQ